MKLRRKLTLLLVLVAIVLIFPLNIYISNNWVQVQFFTLFPDKLPIDFKDFTILQISDTHLQSHKDFKKDLIKAAEDELASRGKQLDCIVLTGDILDNGTDMMSEFVAYISRYVNKYPVFFTAGNHEYIGDVQEFESKLKQVGVTILENKSYKLMKGDSHIWLVGVSDAMSNKNDETAAFQAVSPNDFNIVITHSPNNFDKIIKTGGKFVLCGHTHGGQLRVPFLPVIYAPGQGFFPKFGYGFYPGDRPDGGKALMYVNKGVGYTSKQNLNGFRFFNRPEIAIFNLQ